MRIYTKTGDEGQTSVIGGRVRKDDVRVEAYGTIDELNSFVGQAAALMQDDRFKDLREQLAVVGQELFDCGSDLAYTEAAQQPYKTHTAMTERVEGWIDRLEAGNPPLDRFILPGGSPPAASLHICRTVCRRAERRVVALTETAEVNPEVLRYLNRLSDYFFSAARAANLKMRVDDVEYVRGANVFSTGADYENRQEQGE
ncbi:cob(I)yrinic acid a,c-diamide adenosyltransferase [Saccharibacillus sp. CPCC 101409]|uniref:cob(I)yrinic acid a,c-diamide adenosyltransferase n=1 Tax=Saccharibacillus sp. CPCC 101409 TaxID=3058041 RepID=UPI002673E6BF|nr:cob(I)yrinic acid a,c-diamide adenosyltransferase [Saccharibacillus sp. CPCC 101409]MDO3408770.1 cob(I)yrinic acid a,c-diamide adenosyltransferase [Saccharibacillus sp. CPCC 101409]